MAKKVGDTVSRVADGWMVAWDHCIDCCYTAVHSDRDCLSLNFGYAEAAVEKMYQNQNLPASDYYSAAAAYWSKADAAAEQEVAVNYTVGSQKNHSTG